MKFLPAIDIMGGKCVRLSGGDYSKSKVYSENPREIGLQWRDKGIRAVHVVDLDGAKKGELLNISTIIKLREMLDFVREGDEVVITRTDRIARSVLDLQLIVKELTEKGVSLTATEQPISTKDATSKCFLDMLSVFAEFETNIRKERQMEGIAKAKLKGVYKGGKSKISIEEIKKLKGEGLGATAIARKLNIHRDSVYRLLKK